MNTTTTLDRAAAVTPAGTTHPLPAVAAGAPRFDLYTAVHKALRQFMGDTLARIGAMDVSDADEREPALAQLQSLLATLRAHLAHENDFIHSAIEARRPGAARRVSEDHVEHLHEIAALETEALALQGGGDADRHAGSDAAALHLYRHLALFMAENIEHMQVEETAHNTLLWALFSDAELMALEGRLIASVPPAEMALFLRWMASAMNFAELGTMLRGMQAGMPGEVFAGVLALMRSHMSPRRGDRLAAVLGLDAQADVGADAA